MASIARRIGVEGTAAADRLDGTELQLGPEALFGKAFELGPTDPDGASLMLGMAILATAHETKDGRLKSGLLLLARLVAQSDANRTLGPAGSAVREVLFPTGWKELVRSWPRFRYAWREGMSDLLQPRESEAATVEALDELTRMHPNEPEPVPVNIQEVWPAPGISFGVSMIGLVFSGLAISRDWRRSRR